MNHRLYIDGSFVDAKALDRSIALNPATQESLGSVPRSSAQDVDAAVAAARRAFEGGEWRESTPRLRSQILNRLASLVRARASELASIETLNNGKPIGESEYDLDAVARCFEYYAGLATSVYGEVPPISDSALSIVVREPVGVAGQIVPWNFPLMMAAWKIAPAICAGCTVVLKPAEETPLSILEFAKSFVDAGLPPGVVNIVTGDAATGRAMVAHRDIDKIAFTGSTSVGKEIMRSAADTVKRLSLELGGKSPNIFFADASFDTAVSNALFSVFVNQGELCSAGSRILVERSIYREFVDALVARARTIRLGPGIERNSRMGPLISERHMNRVLEFIEIGKSEAKLAIGGGRACGGWLDRGFFVEPTIFYDVDNSARIAQEEIFGPVACVVPFDSEDEAISIANRTDYGLAAAVWTHDIFRALRCVRRLRTGTVWVNHMQPTHVEAPWGGQKQSGFGRELGKWGLEEYLHLKNVYLNLNDQAISWP